MWKLSHTFRKLHDTEVAMHENVEGIMNQPMRIVHSPHKEANRGQTKLPHSQYASLTLTHTADMDWPLKGRRRVANSYRMHPAAQTSLLRE